MFCAFARVRSPRGCAQDPRSPCVRSSSVGLGLAGGLVSRRASRVPQVSGSLGFQPSTCTTGVFPVILSVAFCLVVWHTRWNTDALSPCSAELRAHHGGIWHPRLRSVFCGIFSSSQLSSSATAGDIDLVLSPFSSIRRRYFPH